MTKARTRAAKIRAKRAAAGLPGLAAIPERKKRGGARMAEIKSDPEASQVALAARANHMGKDGSNPKVRAEMRSQSLAGQAGAALTLSTAPDTAKRLAALYCDFCACYERYTRIALEVGCHAKSGKIEMLPNPMPDAMEYTPDLRTEDERHRAAINKWGEWKGRLNQIGVGHTSAIWTAFHGFRDLHDGAKVTAAGARFVAAMELLDQGA